MTTNEIRSGFSIRCGGSHFALGGYYATVEARDAAFVSIPKMCKARRSTLSGAGGAGGEQPIITMDVEFRSNGVNKGVNETGVKRVRAILRWLDAQGIEPEFATNYGGHGQPDSREMLEAIL
jgi:hypothetical protein